MKPFATRLMPIMMLLLVAAGACRRTGGAPEAEPLHEELNSVYYWKTVFRPDSADHSFMRRHDIGRIYLRMFDVTVDRFSDDPEARLIPNATVLIDSQEFYMIQDSLPESEFVPVVYITLDALKEAAGNEGELASNIVTRVKNMVSYHELPNVEELQLDCDWTASTRKSFFALCDSVRSRIKDLALPWRLSSTIRLHQLSLKAPPVDNGVLMVYNTGSFDDPDASNSILDARDVEPYLKYLASYPLHLDVAYPAYSWQLLFHRRRFVGLMSGIDVGDTTRFLRRGANVYEARRDIAHGGTLIRTGDVVREERSTPADVLRVKEMIESRLAGRPHSNIIYHLDSDNLSKFPHDEIEKIFATGR